MLTEIQQKFRYSALYTTDLTEIVVLRKNLEDLIQHLNQVVVFDNNRQRKELEEATKTENIEQCA